MNKLPNRFQLLNKASTGKQMKYLCQKYGINYKYYDFDSDCYYQYSNGKFYSSDNKDESAPILTYEEIKAILEPPNTIEQWEEEARKKGIMFEETYTIEQLKTEKIAVKCISIEQGRKLGSYIGNHKDFNFFNYEEFYVSIDGNSGWDYTNYYQNKGYKIINYNQINFMANTQKQIGWKIKDNKFLDAAKLIANNPLDSMGEYLFQTNSIIEGKFKEIGALEMWFDAVYELEEKTIIIGNNNVKLVIKGNEIKGRDIQTNYKEVNNAYLAITSDSGQIELGGYALYFDRTVRWVRVGCTDQNNLVSISEIDSVLKLCQSGK